jgi:arylsulfatase A-like enzyme
MASFVARLLAYLLGTAGAAAAAALALADADVSWRAAYFPQLAGNLAAGAPFGILLLLLARPLGAQRCGSLPWLLAGLLGLYLPAQLGSLPLMGWLIAPPLLGILVLFAAAHLGAEGRPRLVAPLVGVVLAIGGGFYCAFSVHFEMQDWLASLVEPRLPAEREGPIPEAPDVILVSIDTLRADALVGPRPDGYAIPWFDSVRERGTWWDYGYSSSNQTLPGHASMLSGMDQPRTGVHYNLDLLPTRERLPLVQDDFLAAGFRTAGVISNTLISGDMGFGDGFEAYDDSTTEQYGPMNACLERLRGRSLFGHAPIKLQQAFMLQLSFHALRNAPRKMRGLSQRERGAVTNDQAMSLFDQLYESDRPYFFFLHYLDPHHPYGAPEGFDGRVSGALPEPPARFLGDEEGEYMIRMAHLQILRDELLSEDPGVAAAAQDVAAYYHALYLENVMYVDHLLSLIEARVKASGRPAIWLITSDHGEQFGENDSILHGNHLYEDSVQVPFMAMGPGIAAGVHRKDIPDLADVAPTLLALVGIEPAETMTGRPLFLRDEWPERGHVFADDARIGVRLDAVKLIANRGGENGYDPTMVYDLKADPEEGDNLLSGGVPELLGTLMRNMLAGDRWQAAEGPRGLGHEQGLAELGYVDAGD